MSYKDNIFDAELRLCLLSTRGNILTSPAQGSETILPVQEMVKLVGSSKQRGAGLAGVLHLGIVDVKTGHVIARFSKMRVRLHNGYPFLENFRGPAVETRQEDGSYAPLTGSRTGRSISSYNLDIDVRRQLSNTFSLILEAVNRDIGTPSPEMVAQQICGNAPLLSDDDQVPQELITEPPAAEEATRFASFAEKEA